VRILHKLPYFSPDELLGLTFIRDMDDGQKFRATIARKIVDADVANHQQIRLFVKMSDGQLDELIAHNELPGIIELQHDHALQSPESASWAFKAITNHQGPLKSDDSRYRTLPPTDYEGYHPRITRKAESVFWYPTL
jgi:hypothetical protein